MKGSRARSFALVVGGTIAGLYLALAALSGSLSPLARRPLLDGFGGNLPSYRWVKPPPALASANHPPASGRFVIQLDPQNGAEAAVYYTKDNQVSLAVQTGAIGPGTGQDSVVLTMTPLDPATVAPPPAGMQIAGNVVRVGATFQPNGQSVPGFANTGQVVLFYPTPPTTFGYAHTILRSTDGKTWAPLQTIDSRGQQLATANIRTLGYFAVGQSATTSGSKGGVSIAMILIYAAIGGLALFVLFHIGRVELRRWRRGRETNAQGPAPRRRPPPRSSRRSDLDD